MDGWSWSEVGVAIDFNCCFQRALTDKGVCGLKRTFFKVALKCQGRYFFIRD